MRLSPCCSLYVSHSVGRFLEKSKTSLHGRDAGCLPDDTISCLGTSSRTRVRERQHFIFSAINICRCSFRLSAFCPTPPSSRKMCAMENDTVIIERLASGPTDMLVRPCVDCGLITGRFCDFCLAEERCPTEVWCENQMTPLCSKCEEKHDKCHFCRKVSWATPPPHR